MNSELAESIGSLDHHFNLHHVGFVVPSIQGNGLSFAVALGKVGRKHSFDPSRTYV
jgi:hypothetical protein